MRTKSKVGRVGTAFAYIEQVPTFLESDPMNLRNKLTALATLALVASLQSIPANAIPVACQSVTNNHMYIDSWQVSSCVDAGSGNINGNPATDAFLLSNPSLGYLSIGDANFWQVPVLSSTIGSIGGFSFDDGLWNSWDNIAIGFKFGTGNRGDNWFVYELNEGVSAGLWGFVNHFHRGGGLSHVELYGVRAVPEPATLGLLGAALLGFALLRRRRELPLAR
jgi:hypothetical protein